jgi:hypothetical protein
MDKNTDQLKNASLRTGQFVRTRDSIGFPEDFRSDSKSDRQILLILHTSFAVQNPQLLPVGMKS